MENENPIKPQEEGKADLKALEKELKVAFKEGNHDAVKAGAAKIQALDAENKLAKKLLNKVDAMKKKEEAKVKAGKVKEYVGMLKKLYKEKNIEQFKALMAEFKDFDPENKAVAKWTARLEKLEGKKADKKTEEAPAVAKAPVSQAPAAPAAAAPVVSTPAPATPAPEKAEVKKGNVFTSIFGKKKEDAGSKSIIDTIVAKTDEKKKEVKQEKKVEKVKVKREGGAVNLLKFSKVFMNFTAIFIVFSAGFLYVEFIDEENTALSLVGIAENTGSRLHNATEEVSTLTREEAILEKDIELYKGGYEDRALDTVDNLIEERINWPDIFAKINEVTNSVYELNDFFKYIEYNNYSFDAERKTIRVTGTLSDPLGRNLTRLVELEEAFIFYPKDKNNPDDPTIPFFQGFREFTSFSKTLDESTGRYTSSFQLSFALNE